MCYFDGKRSSDPPEVVFVNQPMSHFTKISLLSALLSAPIYAQTAPANPPFEPTQRLPIWEIRRATTAPLLTASPDDAAWNRAAKLDSLSLALGDGSKNLAPLPTQVLAQWDEKFLYVRFICGDKDVYSPFFKRDEPIYQGDCAEIFLDVVGDGRQVVELQLAPNGAVFDQQILLTAPAQSDENLVLSQTILEREVWMDLGWNMNGLKTATAKTASGWIADFALPAEAVLRRRGSKIFSPMTVRANFLRYDWAPDNSDAWGLKDATGQKRRLNAHNWAPAKHGSPHISPQAMGFLKLVG